MGNMTTLQILQGVHDWVLDKIDEETANFITKTVNDLVNYYTKSETYTKAEVQQIVDAIKQFTYEVVQVLPTASASTMNKIYLVPAPKSEDKNVKEEYITIQDGSTYSWEMLGTTSIDLSNYYTKGQTDSAISSALSSALTSYTTTADLTTLLAQKQDVIQDLADIRSGASAGSTAVQPSTLNNVVKNVVAESGVYDVSANNDNTKFESLSALLSSANLNTLIPTDIRKGGMSIKFVQSSDNKYVKFFCTADEFTTDVTKWQGVDDELTDGSDNLVKSGVVRKVINNINNSVGIISIEQGGLTSSTGEKIVKSTRLRSDFLPNDIDVEVNDGYKIYGIWYYNGDKSFSHYSLESKTKVSVHGYNKTFIKLVFSKDDTTAEISTNDNVIKSFICGIQNLVISDNEKIASEYLQDYPLETETVIGDITTESSKNVDITTGEIVNASSSMISAVTYIITDNDIRATFKESSFSSSNFGWCIMRDNLLIAGKYESKTGIDADIDLSYYVRNYKANKLLIGVNSNSGFDGVHITRTKNTIKDKIDSLYSEISDLQDEISDLQDDVDEISLDFDVPDEDITKTQNYDESAGRRTVDASTGEYASAATDSYAGEYVIQPEDISISYNTTKYTKNNGWVLLGDNNTVIHGEKTDDVADITITLSDYPGAKKFRWCGKENSKTITIIAGVVKNIKDVVEDGYTKYKPFFDGTLNFHFTFAKPQLNNVSATDVEKVTTDIVNGAGLLRLAKNYSRNGVATPLIIYFFGSAGYSTYSTSDFGTVLPYIDYLTKCGYNVMSVFGFYQGFDNNYQTKGSRNFGCPVGMSAIVGAYKYVTDNYNISKNGVYVYGRSFGGSNVILLGFNSNINVRATAMFNCYIGDISNEYSNRQELIKDFIFDGDVNFEWTSQYLLNNYDKVAPWSNLTRGIVNGFASRSDIVYAIMNPNTFMGGHNAEDYVRYQPYPMKMWCPDDDGICAGMKWYRQTVLNSGGRCEYRTMPSNYTDGERVPESVPHHICDTAGPVYATLTTKLGYECENVPVAYKELIDWFDNN